MVCSPCEHLFWAHKGAKRFDRSCYVWVELRQLVYQAHEQPEVSEVRGSRDVLHGTDSMFACRDARSGEVVATESLPRLGDNLV